ncbi:hypothetical protein M5K25_026665 [Dendrobium thyrsiflorum]|uniref:Uncharacterized protein n=1 Tax=Dendrobium thyrsiflorum TaxID=117978 RepID=A0ABD0TXY3_DENTH
MSQLPVRPEGEVVEGAKSNGEGGSSEEVESAGDGGEPASSRCCFRLNRKGTLSKERSRPTMEAKKRTKGRKFPPQQASSGVAFDQSVVTSDRTGRERRRRSEAEQRRRGRERERASEVDNIEVVNIFEYGKGVKYRFSIIHNFVNDCDVSLVNMGKLFKDVMHVSFRELLKFIQGYGALNARLWLFGYWCKLLDLIFRGSSER